MLDISMLKIKKLDPVVRTGRPAELRKIVMYSVKGEPLTAFDSIQEAADFISKQSGKKVKSIVSGIYQVVKNTKLKNKTSYGYQWRYLNEVLLEEA